MDARIAAVILLATTLSSGAIAAEVTPSATLANSCVLSLGSSGTMTASISGTILSSENSGGRNASMTVVAIGAIPTINFAAPSLTTSPTGWSASPTVEVEYTSTGGARMQREIELLKLAAE